jgi:pimeloyl-ACP methyl ester carboxylesterase
MDVRGFGMSTCPTSGHHWSLEGLSHDILALLDGLNVAKAHLVGAKLGGAIAMKFAAGHSDRLFSLAVLSSPVRGVAHTGDPKLLAATSRLATHGVRKWAEDTQRLRLGTEVSEDQIRYWNDFMSSADQNVCVEVDKMAAHMDIIADLPQIKVPTIVFGMEASAFQSSKAIEQWARLIPQCEVVTLMGSGYHPAAIHPVECAHRVLEFIDRKTSFVG